MANSNKTHATNKDPVAFLQTVDDPIRQADSFVLLELMERITGKPPVMWGDSLIGYGSYQYRYASGREGVYLVTGFSPRKANLSIYILPGFDNYKNIMQNLGKYTTGRSCLNVKKLADIDLHQLEKLVACAYQDMTRLYACS